MNFLAKLILLELRFEYGQSYMLSGWSFVWCMEYTSMDTSKQLYFKAEAFKWGRYLSITWFW